MKKWLLILIAAVAIACTDRNQNYDDDVTEGTTSSGNADKQEDEIDQKTDLKRDSVESEASTSSSSDQRKEKPYPPR